MPRTKKTLIGALVCINAVLLVGLLFWSDSPAFGQVGGSGNVTMMSAKVAGQSYDILYVLDARDRKLYAFHRPSARSAQLVPVVPRDLTKDFNR